MSTYGRTYAADTFNRAMAQWAVLGPFWEECRQASSSWSAYPPSDAGDEYREGEHPSQRTIIWRALDYRREETLEVIRASRSWRDVVGWILEAEQQLDHEAELRERAAERAKAIHKHQEERAMDAIYARFGFKEKP